MSAERTDREQWEERAALQFEKNAEYLQECIAGWIKRGDRTDAAGFEMAARIAVKVETWREAARAMRQPYLMRLELEQPQ